jgi:catechol 2,3-dioxygenase-like lactoylglutathione lyase family enzyme
MKQYLHRFILLVKDLDEAIDYFTRVIGFELIEDTQVTPTKRWVVVRPSGDYGCGIVLAKADKPEQLDRIGNQTGGKVLVVLHTDDIDRDYIRLQQHNVEIVRGPVVEEWGKVIVFRDLYGNLWDLIEPASVQ